MKSRVIVLIGTVFAALLALAVPASAQGTGSGNATVGGSDVTLDPGQTITVSGSGCGPNVSVDFFIDGAPAGGTTADQNGNFSGPMTAPNDLTPGTHHVTAVCGAEVLSFEITRNLDSSATGTGAAPPLARTGSSSTVPLTSVALALLAAGGLILLFARSRRRHTSD